MKELLYEGKAKQVFRTSEDVVEIRYKDDTTAFDGAKKEALNNKGIFNNKISSLFYEYLNKEGIPTHFMKQLDERSSLCKQVDILPLEVIVRNIATGSLTKRLGITEGTVIDNAIIELCYKDDSLHDPFINEDHVRLLNICSKEDLDVLYEYAHKINTLIKEKCESAGLVVVDFKLEFGKTKDGVILLADEISCDTCRFWDKETNEKLDKDRFRQDLGNVVEAYENVYQRLVKVC